MPDNNPLDDSNEGSNEDLDCYDEISDQDLELLIREYDHLESDFREMRLKCDDLLNRMWRDSAGPIFDGMRQSKENTIKNLRNSDANVRQAAVHLAYDHWELRDLLAQEYERIAREDSVDEVRAVAILALGATYAGTKDKRLGLFLSEIASNVKVSDFLRFYAYSALEELDGHRASAGKGGDISEELIKRYRGTQNGPAQPK